jgi:hypothetical protein
MSFQGVFLKCPLFFCWFYYVLSNNEKYNEIEKSKLKKDGVLALEERFLEFGPDFEFESFEI